MILPSIKYDFTILRRIIMTFILIKTIHTSHKKIRKISIYGAVYFYFLSNNLLVSYQYFYIVFFLLVLQGLMRRYKQVCIFIVYKQQVTP